MDAGMGVSPKIRVSSLVGVFGGVDEGIHLVEKWRSWVYTVRVNIAVTRESWPPNATIETEYEAYAGDAPAVLP